MSETIYGFYTEKQFQQGLRDTERKLRSEIEDEDKGRKLSANLSLECERLIKALTEERERTTTLEQLLENIITAHCGHYADVDRVVALQRAITEADEFLNV